MKEYRQNKYIVREYFAGEKTWYMNGVRHREDGPAIECINGVKGWWLNNKPYSEGDWKIEMRQRKLERLGL